MAKDHKYANFNLPAWSFECIESNKSYGEFPKLYYNSFYEMPEILVDVRRFLQYIFTYFHITGTWGDWGVYSILKLPFTLGIH